MERTYDSNSKVDYVDEHGVRHSALVTQWWLGLDGTIEGYHKIQPGAEPGCNLLFVTSEPDKRDNYGTQIERRTSMVHKTVQAAPGNYWLWPDEAAK